jgi:glycosyltransferase involved in cell wall biosynthesis
MNIKILHYAAPPIVGGVESTMYHHSRLLTAAGYPVEIIAGRGRAFDEGVPLHLIREIDSRHPEVINIGNSLANGQVEENFHTLRDKIFAEINSLLENSDVIIVHNAITLHKNLALTAALYDISKQNNYAMIAWCHDFAWQDALYTPELHPGYPWDLLRTAWPNTHYVTVSQHQRKMLADLLNIQKSEISVVPPGIDVDQILNISPFSLQMIEKLNLLEAEPVILLPARLTRRKNIEFALRVISAVRKDYPKVALLITGPPGPHNPKNIAYLESLRDLVKELNTGPNTHFIYELGENDKPLTVPDEVIADFYRFADILLFPSLREGFGIPILEAGLTRTAIFASAIPSIQESSAGLVNLFDPEGDPGDVGAEITSFIRSDPIYKLRRRILEQYTWSTILSNKLIPIIEKVILQ